MVLERSRTNILTLKPPAGTSEANLRDFASIGQADDARVQEILETITEPTRLRAAELGLVVSFKTLGQELHLLTSSLGYSEAVRQALRNAQPAVPNRTLTYMPCSGHEGGSSHFSRHVSFIASVHKERAKQALANDREMDRFRPKALDPAERAAKESLFTRLVEQSYHTIYTYILRKVPNSETALDITQETMAKAFTAISYADLTQQPLHWLYRIASNECANYFRAERFHPSLEQCAAASLTGEPSKSPENTVWRSYRQQAVREALAALPSSQVRDCLILFYYYDTPYREISRLLGLPLGTVKVRIHMAKAALRAMLAQKGIDQGLM